MKHTKTRCIEVHQYKVYLVDKTIILNDSLFYILKSYDNIVKIVNMEDGTTYENNGINNSLRLIQNMYKERKK